MKLAKLCALATITCAVAGFSCLQTAEAGFGIKLPNIGSVVKTPATTNTVSRVWPKYEMKFHYNGTPVSGVKVYQVTTTTTPVRQARYRVKDGVQTFTDVTASKYLGTTDTTGWLRLKNYNGGDIVSLVCIAPGIVVFTTYQERMRYHEPIEIDLTGRPKVNAVDGLHINE